jgi:hypothetical protein
MRIRGTQPRPHHEERRAETCISPSMVIGDEERC